MTHLLIANYHGTMLNSIELDGRRCLTIGRSPRCDLTLDAPSISRRHAVLLEQAGRWHVADTGSRNGIDSSGGTRSGSAIEPGGWVRVGPAFLWLDSTDEPDGFGTAMGLAPVDAGVEAPSLVVLEQGATRLRRLDLTGLDVVTIGRDPACDLTLSDPAVAPLHSALYVEHRGWYVTDLGSPGGTWVEGGPTRRRRLLDDRLIRIGETRLWIEGSAHGGQLDGFGANAETMAPLDPGPERRGLSTTPSRPVPKRVTAGRLAG